MEKFTQLTAVATPFPRANIDTDVIIPARYLKTVKRTGLGAGAFHALRYRDDGSLDPDVIFNRPPYDTAQILIAGANFGCGSSREHAAWALRDLGYRCIIAPSFADIFASNCFKNAILTIELPDADVARLIDDAERGAERGANATVTVDLEAQTVSGPDGGTIGFDIDPFRKHCLLNGLDEIALTLRSDDAIAAFEQRDRLSQPWLYADQRQ